MDDNAREPVPGTIAARFYLGREVGWWWAAAAVAGAALISLTTGVSVIRLALPVAVMAIYVAAAYRLPNVDVPKLADSVYFMGFLWTLWALIDTTVFKHEVSQEGILRVFGYALVTTTIGMFLRLFLVQFHYSVDDQAAGAKEELDIVVARLRTQLEASEQSLKTFATSIEGAENKWRPAVDQHVESGKQVLADAVEALQGRLAEAGEEVASSLQSSAATASAGLKELETVVKRTVSVISTSAQKHERAVAQAEDVIAASTVNIAGALEQLNSKISALDLPPDLLKQRIEAMSAGLLAAVTALQTELENSTMTIKNQAADLNDALGDLSALGSVGSAASDTAKKLTEVQEPLSQLRVAFEQLKGTFDYAPGEVRTRIESILSGLAKDVQEHSAAAAKLSSDFSTSQQAITDTVQEVVGFVRARLAEQP